MDSTTPSEKEITKLVIGSAMKVHTTLGCGFVEYVYRNALLIELRRLGLVVEIEKPLKVLYHGTVVGEFSVDLFVNDWLVLELKAISTLSSAHEVQMVNYLTALQQDFGLLLNFGAPSLQFRRQFRRQSQMRCTLPTFNHSECSQHPV